jgi:Holliday junction resolvasome RuvABC endonuclease subunit
MAKVLGIDCSSTTIGYCVLEILDNHISFVSANYLKPIKTGSIIERIVDTRNKITKIISDIKPDYIGIEEIIKFMKGASSANTIIMLTTYNRMIGLVAYDYLNSPPQFFNVLSIRHGLKFNKVFPKKEDIPELVAKHLNIKFPYEYNKKGKIKTENGDKADAIAVALYYSFLLTNQIKSKKQKAK